MESFMEIQIFFFGFVCAFHTFKINPILLTPPSNIKKIHHRLVAQQNIYCHCFYLLRINFWGAIECLHDWTVEWQKVLLELLNTHHTYVELFDANCWINFKVLILIRQIAHGLNRGLNWVGLSSYVAIYICIIQIFNHKNKILLISI